MWQFIYLVATQPIKEKLEKRGKSQATGHLLEKTPKQSL